MASKLAHILTRGMALVCVVTTLATVQITGTVKSVEGKDIIAVTLDNGKEYQVAMRGVREGAQVECTLAKHGKLEGVEPKKGGM